MEMHLKLYIYILTNNLHFYAKIYKFKLYFDENNSIYTSQFGIKVKERFCILEYFSSFFKV